MMYFVTVYSTQGKNSLQKALVSMAERLNCTLIKSTESKKECIERLRNMLNDTNQQFPKCSPCKFARSEEHISFQSPDGLDSFVQFTFKQVRFIYEGGLLFVEGGQK